MFQCWFRHSERLISLRSDNGKLAVLIWESHPLADEEVEAIYLEIKTKVDKSIKQLVGSSSFLGSGWRIFSNTQLGSFITSTDFLVEVRSEQVDKYKAKMSELENIIEDHRIQLK